MGRGRAIGDVGGSIWRSLRDWARRVVFGQPLATSVALEHRLPILLALPVFASDAMSSVAYATEEILIQFEEQGFGPAALAYLLPISLAIVLLIAIVGTSYRLAIRLYPSGGGAYAVSRDTLGTPASLLAASALTIDYILTVAVSVSAGVQYLLALPLGLDPAVSVFGIQVSTAVLVALALIWTITLVNLRGTRESGWAFAFPAYAFLIVLLTMFGGVIWLAASGGVPPPQDAHGVAPTPTGGLAAAAGVLLILRAFASGSAALTGVETVATGVTAFEPPETRNAARTLGLLMLAMIVLFSGVSLSAFYLAVLPQPGTTVISQVAATVFGTNPFVQPTAVLFWAVNLVTTLLLMIAANGSFAGLPRLLALVARDGYAPKAFATLGDRLVYNRGILTLAVVSSLLVIVFQATTTLLIPLYAVGVFICFTLTQIGMVKRINAARGPGWRRMWATAAFGAIVTGGVAIIQAVSKFQQGAWVVVVLLPLLILGSYLIHRHYVWFSRTMSLHPDDFNPLAEEPEPLTIIVLVSSDIHRGILEGLEAGRAIAAGRPDNILRALHIEMDPDKTPRLRRRWAQYVEPYLRHKIKLDIVPSPYRWLIEPVMDYLDWADLERSGDRVIIVLPEFETGSVITHFLHNFTARRLRAALLNRPHVTVVSSRYFMRPMAWRLGRGGLVY